MKSIISTKFLELIKSIKRCFYKAFIFFIFSSIVIEVARTKLAIFLSMLRKQKEKTKLFFIQITANLLHI